MLTKILILAGGGALGTLARYALSGLSYRYLHPAFPYGTLIVNLLGSFLIGLLWGWWETHNLNPGLRLFLFIGLLGSFTTFSTFALESFQLLRDGFIRAGLLNILLNNFLGLGLVIIGFLAARSLHQAIYL
jgi:CrcB protein